MGRRLSARPGELAYVCGVRGFWDGGVTVETSLLASGNVNAVTPRVRREWETNTAD